MNTSEKKKWVTNIQAIDPNDGELKTFAGPYIEADSIEEAIEFTQKNGLGYCTVVGKLVIDFVLHEN